uniref:Uncharacterized protein n=1 Tax=Nelumbo nucifera TaxID=4432 RepID=A0A822Z0S9_NELNU|nr:TPA_asm: hypothetical protein HUJ06_005718 [Nelumbo nucifera]
MKIYKMKTFFKQIASELYLWAREAGLSGVTA